MKIKIIVCVFFQLLFTGKSFSSFELNEQVQQAYLQIIRLHFDEGKLLLDKERQSNPSNQLPLLYYNYIDFLKAFVSEEKKDIETFNVKTKERLKELRNENSPFFLYAQAELLLQEFIIKLKSGDYVSAAWKIRKVYVLIGKNADLFPGFLLNKKASGMLNLFIGSIPQNYHWLADLAGLKGTITEGISQLTTLLKETTGKEYQVYQEEILFYLSNLQVSFSQNPNFTALVIDMMLPFCSGNALMRFSISNVFMNTGRNDDALQYLTDTASLKESYPCYILHYKTGIAKLNKLDFSAEKEFQKFIVHFHGMNFLRSTYQKLAWIYLLQGDRKKYDDCIRICKVAGNNTTDEDKEATEESGNGEDPNLIMLRARLLFDGGYYKEAMEEIAGKTIDHFPHFRDQLEVTYRFARILQKLDQTEKAISYFEQTLKNGSSSKYYYAANSALMLGFIYEEKKDFKRAKSYFLKCLEMRNHGYQNSIDQKAKAGLARVNMN